MREWGFQNKKRRLIRVLEVIILMSLLIACSKSGDVAMPAVDSSPEVTQSATPSAAPTAAPTFTPTSAPEPELPYKGDGSKYKYTMTDERDRAWEEDIVYFADLLLDKDSGHPKLIKRGCEIMYWNDVQNGIDDVEWRYESLYEPELRDEFIGRINNLLLSIPEKSDADIGLECAETAAIFNDGHTSLYYFPKGYSATCFPLELMPVYSGDVPEAYIIAAPKGMDDLLLCRLDAINGIPLREIIEKTTALVGHDSIYWVYSELFYTYPVLHQSNVILCNEILHHYGILDESKTAVFSLTDESGVTRDVELTSLLDEEWPDMTVFQPVDGVDESIKIGLRTSNEKESTWTRLIDNGKVLYVRFNRCTDDADKIVEKAVYAVQKTGNVQKVILDFRGNGGGNDISKARISVALDSLEAPCGKYILIDGGSFSSSISITTSLRRFCKDVLLVGTSSGMSPNGNFQTSFFDAPNNLVRGARAVGRCFYFWPGYDEPALMPDITVYQTLEDYRNGIDTVMKYLLRDLEE